MHVTGKERMATERKKAHIVTFDNLAPLAYVLPLNFHFPSVQSGIFAGFLHTLWPFNQKTQGVAENNDVDVVR